MSDEQTDKEPQGKSGFWILVRALDKLNQTANQQLILLVQIKVMLEKLDRIKESKLKEIPLYSAHRWYKPWTWWR